MNKKQASVMSTGNPGVNVTINGLEKGMKAFDKLVSKVTHNAGDLGKYEDQKLTFNDKRVCIHCGTALPDQLSKKRIYCEEIRDQNGNLIKDCKGAFNRQKNKPEVEMHREIINDHKTVDERIESMVAKKGNIVTTEDLNAYDIRLDSSLKFKISDYGLVESYFLKYLIISNPVFKTHKIIRNGQ